MNDLIRAGQVNRFCSNCGKGQTSHNMFCPQCGQPVAAPQAGGWRPMQAMQSAQPWDAPAAAPVVNFSEAFRKTPARPATVGSDVVVPSLQGVLLGLGAGMLVTLLAVVIPSWPWYSGLVAWAIVTPAAWFYLFADHRAALWTIERIINQDVDGDGDIGQPEPPPALPMEVTHRSDEGQFQRQFRFDLPDGVTEADLYEWARGVVLEGRPLAQSYWAGNDKPFSKGNYKRLLDNLTAADVLSWQDDAKRTLGRKVSAAGRRSLLEFVYWYEKRSRQA